MNIQQFGESIKAKYPQYANIDSVELGKQTLAKYPVYANRVQAEPVKTSQPEQKPSVLSSLAGGLADVVRQPANYFEKIGTTIGNAAANTDIGKSIGGVIKQATGITPEQGQRIQQEFQKPTILSPQGQSIAPFKSGREFVGETIKTAANLSTPFVGEGKLIGGALETIAPKVATFGKAVVPRAIEFGGVSATNKIGENIEENKPITEGVGTSFAFGAALPVVGTALGSTMRGLGNVGSKVAERTGPLSERVINSFVKPIQKFLSYGKNPAKALVDDVGAFNSFEQGIQKTRIAKDNVGKQIDQVLSSFKNKSKGITIADAVKPFDDAIQTAGRNGDQTAVSRLIEAKRILTDKLSVDPSTGQIISSGERQLTYISPIEASQIKRQIGKITRYTGNPSDDAIVNDTFQKAYSIIKDKIDKAIPEVAPLNEKWGNLQTAELALTYRDKIASRQNMLPLATRITGIGSLMLGVTTFNPLAIIAGLLNFGIDAALSSPAFKTRLAQFLAKASVAEKEAIVKEVPAFKQILGRVFGSPDKKPVPAVIKQELDKIGEEIKLLPAGRSIPMEAPNPLRNDTSGIIKDAPAPTQLPVEPRPGQLMIESNSRVQEPMILPGEGILQGRNKIGNNVIEGKLVPSRTLKDTPTPKTTELAALSKKEVIDEPLTKLKTLYHNCLDVANEVQKQTGSPVMKGIYVKGAKTREEAEKLAVQMYGLSKTKRLGGATHAWNISDGKVIDYHLQNGPVKDSFAYVSEDTIKSIAKNAGNKKGVLELPKQEASLPVSKELQPLYEEAKKYKSADEFVRAQGKPLYHGTSEVNQESFERFGFDISKNKKGMAESPYGLFTARNIEDAKMYGKNPISLYQQGDVKILNQSSQKWADTLGQTTNEAERFDAVRRLKIEGYDLVESGNEQLILSPEKFKTKFQLEQIWNKANKN